MAKTHMITLMAKTHMITLIQSKSSTSSIQYQSLLYTRKSTQKCFILYSWNNTLLSHKIQSINWTKSCTQMILRPNGRQHATYVTLFLKLRSFMFIHHYTSYKMKLIQSTADCVKMFLGHLCMFWECPCVHKLWKTTLDLIWPILFYTPTIKKQNLHFNFH